MFRRGGWGKRMAEGGSIINLGDLSKPATVLIERVSDAVGGIAKPWQIRRVARAEAKAKLIKAEARIEITEIQRRALQRLVREEGAKQENIESITSKAIPYLNENAKPEEIERDWLTHFFDRSRLISDDEMQTMWGKILAGEANAVGSFSKRTVELVAALDKVDAQLFISFCKFVWNVGGLTPLIFDHHEKQLIAHGIKFDVLNHFSSIGLITRESLGYSKTELPKHFPISYFGQVVQIEFPTEDNQLDIGIILLTQAGQQLAAICASEPSNEHFQSVIERLYSRCLTLSSPVANRALVTS